MQSTAEGEKRTIAADSPPRICGPAERIITPCRPASAAASSRMRPVVTAPLPPEPVMAIEKLRVLLLAFILSVQSIVLSCIQ
ncbi:hypothetical protein TevJSym_ar00640 [endosymbiont of Tevnia jerichonana (vent Tica)]|uniref:Uncharacterized protein n=1 Tax=endosymbiont of Tevnia jerichonana (vent Tica) TaxID=1049564 RepID=G2FGT5_9GAMM|nr:hypothetical protein TevJSym_ar00640 [endosymbiont of Tevnia jerichonana (vent Tica)]